MGQSGEAAAADGTTVYTASRLFDGHRWVEPPRVAVRNGRVIAVGGHAPEAVDVDLGDLTLLPGFVDCHQHLVFDGNGTLEDQVAGRTDAELLARARSNARRALEGGVTTLRDLGDRNFVTLGLRGDPDLPTILCSGPPITPVQGHCWYLGGECTDTEAVRDAVRDRIDRGCDVIKIMATGGNLTPTTPPWKSQFTLDDIRMVVDEAHRAGIPVASHCHGDGGIRDSVMAGVDTLEHCSFLNEEMNPDAPRGLIELVASSGIAVSATFGRCADAPPYPDAWVDVVERFMRAFTDVHALGGTIVVGSDAGIGPAKPHDVAPLAIHPLMAIGMTPLEAMAALTSRGADALGMSAKGRVSPGADADMVAVDGDPTSDPDAITRIVHVWRAGRPVVDSHGFSPRVAR